MQVNNKYLAGFQQDVTKIKDNTVLVDCPYLKITKGPVDKEYNNVTTNCKIDANIPYNEDSVQLIKFFNTWAVKNRDKCPITNIILDMIKSEKFRAKVPTIPPATDRAMYNLGTSAIVNDGWNNFFGNDAKQYMYNLFCGVASDSTFEFTYPTSRILTNFDRTLRHMLDVGMDTIDLKSQIYIADMFTMKYDEKRRVLGNWCVYTLLAPAILTWFSEKYRNEQNKQKSIVFEPVTYINYVNAGTILYSTRIEDSNDFPKPANLKKETIESNLKTHFKNLVKFTDKPDLIKEVDDLQCPFLIFLESYKGINDKVNGKYKYKNFEDYLKIETKDAYVSQENIMAGRIDEVIGIQNKDNKETLKFPRMIGNDTDGWVSHLHYKRSYPFYNNELNIIGRFGVLLKTEDDYDLNNIFYGEYKSWTSEVLPDLEHKSRFTARSNDEQWCTLQNGYVSQISITYAVKKNILFKIRSTDKIFKEDTNIIGQSTSDVPLVKIWTPHYYKKNKCSYDYNDTCCEKMIRISRTKTIEFNTGLIGKFDNIVIARIANAIPDDERFIKYYADIIKAENDRWASKNLTVEPVTTVPSAGLFKAVASWFNHEYNGVSNDGWVKGRDSLTGDNKFDNNGFKHFADDFNFKEDANKNSKHAGNFITKSGSTLHVCAAHDYDLKLEGDFSRDEGKLCWFRHIQHDNPNNHVMLRSIISGADKRTSQRLYETDISKIGGQPHVRHYMEKEGDGSVEFIIRYEFEALFKVTIPSYYSRYFITAQDAVAKEDYKKCPQLICPVEINKSFWMITSNTLRRWCLLMLSKDVIEQIFKEFLAFFDAEENKWIVYLDRFLKTFGTFSKAICNENYPRHTFMNLPFGPPLLKIDYNFLLHFSNLSALHDLDFIEHPDNVFNKELKQSLGTTIINKSKYVARDGKPRTVDRIYNQIIDASYFPDVMNDLDHITHMHIPTAMSDLFKYSDMYFNADDLIQTFVTTVPFDDADAGLGRLDIGRIFASKVDFNPTSIKTEIDPEEEKDGNGLSSGDYLQSYQNKGAIHFPKCSIELFNDNINIKYDCMADEDTKYTLYLSPKDTVDSIGMDIKNDANVGEGSNIKTFKWLHIPFKDRAELPPPLKRHIFGAKEEEK